MSKIVFTADVQLHNHSDYSVILLNGRNSRLQNGLDCLRQAAELAGRDGTVVVDGDLFHDRKQLDIGLFHDAYDVIADTAKSVRVVLSVGNHDQYLRSGERHSLAALASINNVDVVDRYSVVHRHATTLHIIAFRPDLDEVRTLIASAAAARKQGHNLLVLHAPVLTASLGGDRFSESGLSAEDLMLDCWSGVILGHYHKPQQLFNRQCWYVGSPYQVDWSEAGDAKRFLVWDGTKMSSVPVQDMPCFLSLPYNEWAQFTEEDRLKHFYELSVSPTDEVQKDLPPNVKLGAVHSEDTPTGQTAELSSFDVGSAVRSWMEQHGHADLADLAITRLTS